MVNKHTHQMRFVMTGSKLTLFGFATLLFCSCQSAIPRTGHPGSPSDPMALPQGPRPAMVGMNGPASGMQGQTHPMYGPMAAANSPANQHPAAIPGHGATTLPSPALANGLEYANRQVSFEQEAIPGQPNTAPDRIQARQVSTPNLPANAIVRSQHIPRDPCLPGHLPTGHGPFRQLAQGEYLIDGGDRNQKVLIAKDWSIRGLDMEDTVAHFDTLEGERRIEASNRVEIYAPRFGSVRKRYGLVQNQAYGTLGNVDNEQGLTIVDDRTLAINAHQNLEPIKNLGQRSASVFKDRTRGLTVENPQPVSTYSNVFSAYENFSLIRFGRVDNNEKARLADAIESAKVWNYKEAVQALVDNREAIISLGVASAQETVGLDEKASKPDLRIVKLASAAAAQPGDEIEFTIRFDNTGNEKVGNVTILDNLTPRLEYIEGSAQCSLDFDFFTTENEGGSLLLRWEIKEPLEVGEGGVIRFRCIVR